MESLPRAMVAEAEIVRELLIIFVCFFAAFLSRLAFCKTEALNRLRNLLQFPVKCERC